MLLLLPGGGPVSVGKKPQFLDDETLAGSVPEKDGAFSQLET
jgi:hypothetical protein